MSIEPITIPMSIEVNDVTIDSTIETNEVTIESTFDAKIEVVEGGDITVQSLTVTENGTTTAPTGKAYSPVIVNVPASAVDTGTKNIISNGNNQDVVGYAKVNVAVPNSYSAADEGKVVSSGALVSQTSATFTSNGTYDTTTNDEVVVNVSGGTPTLITKTITANGTYSAEDDDADGYSEVTVNVSGGDPNAELRKLVDNSLTSFIDETITLLPAYAFYGKSSLATLQCHNVTSVSGGWLGGPNAAGSPAVEVVALPKVTSIGGNGSNNNRNIKKLDFTALSSIGIYGFSTNQALNVLVLRKDGVVALNGINAFSDTPFASGKAGGTLYVPQALISSYQSASNWSTILGYANNQIKSIESTHTDPNAPIDLTLYYADGTPIS